MPKLSVPVTIAFDYVVAYEDLPLVPVRFSNEGQLGVTVLCLLDSGASGVLLPAELAAELGVVLETQSGPIIGINGVSQGWVHPVTASLLDVDSLDFQVDAVFLEHLPVALLGRSPLFEALDIAFRHREGSLFFALP